MKLDQNHLLRIPKVELHLHLDCSLSYEVVKKLRPQTTEEDYYEDFTAPEKSTDLADFLRSAINGIALMQTEEAIRAVVDDVFTQLERDNVIYTEMRLAPLLHLDKGLRPEEVVEIAAESISNNSTVAGIKAGLILCTLRNYSEAQSFQTIKLVDRYIKDTSVVGFGIAGDEAGYPIDAHINSFRYAVSKDIPRTAHAGEAKGPQSVWETLEHFKPERLAHGVRSIEDEKLVEFLIKNEIHLDLCPTCNIQTDIYEEYPDHPIDLLFKYGVSLGISTDGRSTSNITLTEEYQKLAATFGWGADQFYECNVNSLSHAFISQSEKEELTQLLISESNNGLIKYRENCS